VRLDYRLTVLNAGRSDVELVDVVMPPQPGVSLAEPATLEATKVPVSGYALVPVVLSVPCDRGRAGGPRLIVVARTPDGREQRIDRPVHQLVASLDDLVQEYCDGATSTPQLEFVSARGLGGATRLSMRAHGGDGTKVTWVRVSYPGVATRPRTPLPLVLRAEEPVELLVDVSVSDCLAARAGDDTPTVDLGYEREDGTPMQQANASPGDESFLAARFRLVYASCG
jgi:hypothetical protein